MGLATVAVAVVVTVADSVAVESVVSYAVVVVVVAWCPMIVTLVV